MSEAQRNLVEKKMAIGHYLKQTRSMDLKDITIKRELGSEGNIFRFITSTGSVTEICIKKL